MEIFNRTKVSEAEVIAGMQLTSANVIHIRNQILDLVEEKLNLPFTPNDVLSYTQKEAYLKGQIDILRYLLDASETQTQSFNFDSKEQ